MSNKIRKLIYICFVISVASELIFMWSSDYKPNDIMLSIWGLLSILTIVEEFIALNKENKKKVE